MQLGRPVQREAVITGAVDYGSFIYGELDNSGHGDGEKKTTKTGGSWAGVLMKGGAPAPQAEKPTGLPSKAPPSSDKSTVPATASTPSGSKAEKKANEKKGSKPPDGTKKEGAPKQDGEGKKNRRRRAGSHGDKVGMQSTLPR